MNFSKIKDNNNLIRDLNSNSIINTNSSEYENYLSRKKVHSEKNQKIDRIEDEVNEIKNDLNEIKNLLRSILNEPR